jgi:hypothetical protein
MKGLLIVVLIVGSYWWFWGRTDSAVNVIEAQLQAVDRRDFASAYEYLSTETKRTMTPESLQEQFGRYAPVMNRSKTQFWSRSIDNDVATISGIIESLDTKQTKARYVLIKEGDHWAIKSISFN